MLRELQLKNGGTLVVHSTTMIPKHVPGMLSKLRNITLPWRRVLAPVSNESSRCSPTKPSGGHWGPVDVEGGPDTIIDSPVPRVPDTHPRVTRQTAPRSRWVADGAGTR
ncbi:hypothetical protein ABIA33_004815 [Streptacidiphilus sp. MAP12-16]